MPAPVIEPANPTPSDRQQIISNLMGVGVMYVASIFITLFTNMVLARALGPKLFGQYTYIMVIVGFLTLPLAGGLVMLLVREVASYAHNQQWGLLHGVIRAARGWVAGSFAVLFVFYLAIVHWLPSEGKWSLLGYALILSLLTGLLIQFKSTIKGLGYPALAEMPAQLLQPLFLLLVCLALLALDAITVHSVLWANIVVAGVSLFVAFKVLTKVTPAQIYQHSPQYQFQVWSVFILRFTAITIVGTASLQVSVLLLGMMASDSSVASFRVASQMTQFVGLALELVNLVIAPHIVRIYQAGDLVRLRRLSLLSARFAFVIALVVGVILEISGKDIIHWAFGPDYVNTAYVPMVLLVLGQWVNVAAGSVGLILSMCGHEKQTLYGHMVGLGCGVLLSLILIPSLQATGAALAFAITLGLWNVVLYRSVLRHINIRPGIF